MKISGKWFSLFFDGALAFACVGICLVLLASHQHIKDRHPANFEIEVMPLEDGNRLISGAEVEEYWIGKLGYDPTDLKVGNLPLAKWEGMIEALPFVKDAQVYLDRQFFIQISISQRQPVLRVLNGRKSQYLDKDLVYFPLSQKYSCRVPVVSGELPEMAEDEDFKGEMTAIIQRLEEDVFANKLIDQMHRTKEGEWIFTPVLGDLKIKFGKWENEEEKLSRLREFYDKVLPIKGWNKYEHIDLRYEDQVIAKMKV